MNRLAPVIASTVLTVVLAGSASAQIPVLANNPAPGDLFTNPGPSNQGQAIGATGWYYNNVRNNGQVGIRTDYPRNGNGSVFFYSGSGAAKADVEYLVNAALIAGNYFSAGIIAPLSDLQTLTYEWYRDSMSTVPASLHPAVRILLDADGDLSTIGDRGGLVWERAYNSLPVPTDTWVADTITDTSFLWNFGLGIGFAADIDGNAYPYDETLLEWKNYFPNAVIIGFSMGVGSGWNGIFQGAVDSIAWQGTGPLANLTSFNFELAGTPVVPEPGTMALLGAGLMLGGLVTLRRARRNR
ncbi:MAG: PEP-CTERM sorting domain-containing protein [Chloroherpetonaceae bacterium]|nr:PEP-CTERM sorting domain-containing protein [Chthonomonadaceae bacterium]MDW8206611.1 PEP-CTERM sorting domain-containing protein [Chloroherpetonaceae bacterium]